MVLFFHWQKWQNWYKFKEKQNVSFWIDQTMAELDWHFFQPKLATSFKQVDLWSLFRCPWVSMQLAKADEKSTFLGSRNQYDPMIRWIEWSISFVQKPAETCWNPKNKRQKSINNLSWMDTFRFHKLSTSMDAENTMKVYQNAWEAQICKHAHSIWENANLDHTKFQPHHRVPGLILTWTWLHIHNFQALWNGDTRVSIGHVFYPPWTPSKTGGNSHCSAGPAWGDKTHNKKHRDIRYTKRVGTVDDQVFASLITLGDVVDDNDDDDDGDDCTCLLIAIIWAWEISSASPLPGRKGC